MEQAEIEAALREIREHKERERQKGAARERWHFTAAHAFAGILAAVAVYLLSAALYVALRSAFSLPDAPTDPTGYVAVSTLTFLALTASVYYVAWRRGRAGRP